MIKTEKLQTPVEKLLKMSRWKPYTHQKNNLVDILYYLQKQLLDVESRYQILTKPLTIKKFYQICQSENLTVHRNSNCKKVGILGSMNWNSLSGKVTSIWLSPSLKKGKLLLVASHELAHYFLKHNRTENGGAFFFELTDQNKSVHSDLIELEADLVGHLFTSNLEVENEN